MNELPGRGAEAASLGVDNLQRQQFSRTLDTGPYNSGSNAPLPPFYLLIRLFCVVLF
jgi:hypothetical protein